MGGLRYFGGAVGFGFAAVWIMASLAAAVVCLVAAVAGYGALVVAERAGARLAARARSGRAATTAQPAQPKPAPAVEDLPSWADALNSDLGHVYEPAGTTSPLSAEAAYGWPIEDTVVASEALH